MSQPRIQAFRDFAGQLAAQVADQLCAEFEREVSIIWNDVVMYRNELDRVAQLLGHQLEREKKLHGVIEEMIGHSTHVNQQAQMMAQQRPGSEHLHHVLEHILGQHNDLLNQTVAGVDQTTQVLSAHANNASQLKQEAITAENEFMRIVQLLQQPVIPLATPPPTIGSTPMGPIGSMPPPVPGSVKYSPGHVNFSTPPPGGPLPPDFARMPPSPRGGVPYMVVQPQPPFPRGPMPPGGVLVRPPGSAIR